MRRKHRVERPLRPDPKFNSLVVAKFINHMMKAGKKTIARQVFYEAMVEIERKSIDPIETFSKALHNITPRMELRSKRVGGANYQIPVEVQPDRGVFLAMRWLIGASRKRKGASMAKRLSKEVIEAASEQGEAFRKRQETHKMAEANKAFAHFGRNRNNRNKRR